MKTDNFIEFLAKGASEEPTPAVGNRLLVAASLGFLASLTVVLVLIGPLPADVFTTATPWIKFAYTLLLIAVAARLTAGLSKPLARLTGPVKMLWLVLLAMLAIGAWSLAQTPATGRLNALLGQTWLLCPWIVFLVSLPTLVALQRTVREFAPTRLRQAGFACGLLAGALGAAAYAVACPEDSPAFVAVWYTLGILLTALAGAFSSRWLMRWA